MTFYNSRVTSLSCQARRQNPPENTEDVFRLSVVKLKPKQSFEANRIAGAKHGKTRGSKSRVFVVVVVFILFFLHCYAL